jgi:hypothetical protein
MVAGLALLELAVEEQLRSELSEHRCRMEASVVLAALEQLQPSKAQVHH